MSGRLGTPRPRPGRALLLVALGAGLTATFGVVACQSEPAADFGTPAVSSPAPLTSRVPIIDGKPAADESSESPTRLAVPALKLDVRVDPVGIDAKTGDFAVPPSVDQVGWYKFGPGFTATSGSIVVAGHVDSAAEGKGAFFRLGDLAKGDEITLTGPGGRTESFQVVARERYRKTAIPLEKYFARDGAVRLTLITCGGPFDPKTRHYRDNVVVTAEPR